jgi:protein-disulfide isomerase
VTADRWGLFVSRKQILIALGAIVLIAIAVTASLWWPRSSAEAGTTPRSGKGFQIIASDHTMGNPKAQTVLIEYAAPICPHCARFEENVFPKIKKNYIDTGKVYYVFRVFPLSPYDGAAEKLARCLPKDRYFSFIDMLFRGQPKWDPEYAEQNAALQTPDGVRAALVQMAGNAGMSQSRADHCISDTSLDDQINNVAVDGQNRYNVSSTPTFVLDGKAMDPPYMREWGYDDMAQLLDQALAAKK